MKWIKSMEKLPAFHQEILVYDPKEKLIGYGSFQEHKGSLSYFSVISDGLSDYYSINENEICYWMPLPLPPSINDKNDPIKHPPHYNQGKIEVIDFIEDQKLSYHKGNAIKYICRAGIKDPSKEIEDLKKALWYLERIIKNLEYK